MRKIFHGATAVNRVCCARRKQFWTFLRYHFLLPPQAYDLGP